MERRTRGQIAMGISVEGFSLAHPMESAGYQAAVAALSSALAETRTLEGQQREGFIAERRGTAVRRGVVDQIWRIHLPHLWAAARRSEKEQPDFARTFLLKPTADTIDARLAAASAMLETARAHQDVLVRYGMGESVMDDLGQALAECSSANDQRLAGRAAHVGATARLNRLGQEIVELARVIDGLNRVRFKNDASLLAQWISVSAVRAMSKVSLPEANQGSGPAGPSPSDQATRPAA